MIDLESVGRKIAALRQTKKMSQDMLANRLYVSRQAVSAWELGKSAPSIDNVIELGKIFSVSFEDILCLNENKAIDPLHPFEGHSRDYVIHAVINREIVLDIPSFFYHCTGEERTRLIEAMRRGVLPCPYQELQHELSSEEKSLLTMKRGKER